jgi:hypothetical protein
MVSYDSVSDPILERIAHIGDEAVIVQEVMVKAAASGLDTVCRGIRLASEDDKVAVDRGTLVYDVLYPQSQAERNPPSGDGSEQ